MDAGHCRLTRPGLAEGRRAEGKDVPKTELAVAGGVGVPVGQRLEGVAQPGPRLDEGCERRVDGHGELRESVSRGVG